MVACHRYRRVVHGNHHLILFPQSFLSLSSSLHPFSFSPFRSTHSIATPFQFLSCTFTIHYLPIVHTHHSRLTAPPRATISHHSLTCQSRSHPISISLYHHLLSPLVVVPLIWGLKNITVKLSFIFAMLVWGFGLFMDFYLDFHSILYHYGYNVNLGLMTFGYRFWACWHICCWTLFHL